MRYNALQLLTYAALSASGLVIPLYAADIGASTTSIGAIVAAFGLASLASSLVFGRLGDRRDRKRILQFGFALSSIALVLQATARTPSTLLAARVGAGFALGIIPPALTAFVYEIRRPLGKFTSFNAFGWLVAASLVVGLGFLTTHILRDPRLEAGRQFLIGRIGIYEALFFVSALLCLAGLVVTVGMPTMRRALNVPLFPVAILRNGAHVYASVFLRHLGAAAIWTIYPLYIVDTLGGGLAMVGWIHIVNMVSQILVLRNVERFRRVGSARWLIGIGLVLSGLTFWSFTLARNAVELLPLQVPLGVSFACLWLGSLKEVMERNVERATATGLLNASLNLSNVVGPLLGGFVAAAYGFRAIMNVAAIITALAFILFLAMAKGRPSIHAELPSLGAGPAGQVAP